MRVRQHRRGLVMMGAAALIVGVLCVVTKRALSFGEDLLLALSPHSTVSREPEGAKQATLQISTQSNPSAMAAASPAPAKREDAPPEPALSVASVPEDATVGSTANAPSSRLCPSELRLLGSIVNAARPTRSIAAVRVRGGTQLVNIGERVAEFTLLALRPTKAYLRSHEGAVCILPVLPASGEAPVASKAPPATKPQLAKKKALFEPAELSAGIRPLGPNRFGVSAALLEKALGNVGALRRSARFRVKSENNRVVGLELSSIRANSPISHLGLQKGDVVRNLNGHNLAEPDGALQAFAHIKSKPEASLAILRNGKPQTLTFVKE